MKVAKKVVIPVAVVLGIASGCLWFTVGEYLDNHVSNFVAWFVCPAILPLAIAVLLFLANASATTATRTTNSLLFFVAYYAMHWLPMGVFICLVMLAGGM